MPSDRSTYLLHGSGDLILTIAATGLDALDAEHAAKPNYPTCAAEIILWPWSREEHVEALRREAEEN